MILITLILMLIIVRFFVFKFIKFIKFIKNMKFAMILQTCDWFCCKDGRVRNMDVVGTQLLIVGRHVGRGSSGIMRVRKERERVKELCMIYSKGIAWQIELMNYTITIHIANCIMFLFKSILMIKCFYLFANCCIIFI